MKLEARNLIHVYTAHTTYKYQFSYYYYGENEFEMSCFSVYLIYTSIGANNLHLKLYSVLHSEYWLSTNML